METTIPDIGGRLTFPDELVPSLRRSEATISRWDHERVARFWVEATIDQRQRLQSPVV